MSITSINAELISLISLTISLISTLVAAFALHNQISGDHSERKYGTFIRLLEAYEIQRARRDKAMKTAFNSATEGIRNRIPQPRPGIDYLNEHLALAMFGSEEEHEVNLAALEQEIRALNILNELCRAVDKGGKAKDDMRSLLGALLGNEILYYQSKVTDILDLYNQNKRYQLFSTPRSTSLSSFNLTELFSPLPGQVERIGRTVDDQ